jgi:hypothetical protein
MVLPLRFGFFVIASDERDDSKSAALRSMNAHL